MAFDTAQTFRFEPVTVRSGTVCSAVAADAHDFVKLIVVLAGSIVLNSESGERRVNFGDTVVSTSSILHGSAYCASQLSATQPLTEAWDCDFGS
ncbi:hypothetical protein D9V30_12890 [Mycetocola reblochoni]|uniref:Uncharacterized protein n=1 Tax=Mycetocola reblochoni TaxID=331618 RepID=A0A3L6ZIQ4_9MICO|nr:hypothetical protein [Mycetocola reblochoni]RLP67777.1 hypothetical protein D9V30_12890 [Mycetocola reblochoni]